MFSVLEMLKDSVFISHFFFFFEISYVLVRKNNNKIDFIVKLILTLQILSTTFFDAFMIFHSHFVKLHQCRNGSALKTCRREVSGSIPGRACRSSRS